MGRGWFERHPLWKIPFGCLILVLLVGIFVTALFMLITASFRRSDVYQEAVLRATKDVQVRELLGEPIRPTWLITGRMSLSGESGSADLSIPIAGPRGKGVIHAVATKARTWHFNDLHVTIEGHLESINLVGVQPLSGRDF
jgi:hypothetical protein